MSVSTEPTQCVSRAPPETSAAAPGACACDSAATRLLLNLGNLLGVLLLDVGSVRLHRGAVVVARVRPRMERPRRPQRVVWLKRAAGRAARCRLLRLVGLLVHLWRANREASASEHILVFRARLGRPRQSPPKPVSHSANTPSCGTGRACYFSGISKVCSAGDSSLGISLQGRQWRGVHGTRACCGARRGSAHKRVSGGV